MEEHDGNKRKKTRPSKAVHSRAMRSRKSVVSVIAVRRQSPDDTELEMSCGSGFVIHDGPPSTLVLTCQHVVNDATLVRIRIVQVGGVEEFAATVVKEHSTTDIAVLRVPGLRSEHSLALNLTLPGQINEPAVVIGYCNPQDLLDETSLPRLPATSPGCISEDDDLIVNYMEEAGKRIISRHEGITYEIVILNCASMKGVSGGPVVDRHGVIGMACKVGRQIPRMLAVSSITILDVLKFFAGLPVNEDATMEEVASRLVV